MKLVRGAGSFTTVRAVISAVVEYDGGLERHLFCYGNILSFYELTIHVRARLGYV